MYYLFVLLIFMKIFVNVVSWVSFGEKLRPDNKRLAMFVTMFGTLDF
jgi:hypothetical protein